MLLYPNIGTTTGIATTAPPKPLEKALVAGPILAFRYWALYGTQSPTHRQYTSIWLESLYQPTIWQPGIPLVGSCHVMQVAAIHPGSDPPHSGCSCGVYALKQPGPPPQYTPHPNASFIGVFGGTVALWGRVIDHQQGYRAQYAYPHTLFVQHPEIPLPPGFPRIRAIEDLSSLIQDTYGCLAT